MQSNWLILTSPTLAGLGIDMLFYSLRCVCVFQRSLTFQRALWRTEPHLHLRGLEGVWTWPVSLPETILLGGCVPKLSGTRAVGCLFPVPPLHTLTSSRLNMSDLVTCTSQDSWGTRGRKDQGLPRKGRRFEGGAPRSSQGGKRPEVWEPG